MNQKIEDIAHGLLKRAAMRLGFELIRKDHLRQIHGELSRCGADSRPDESLSERIHRYLIRVDKETASWVTDIESAVNDRRSFETEANRLDAEIRAAHSDLTAVGIETHGQAFPDDKPTELGLRQRIALAICAKAERDFAWALEQVHAGKTVTHPCIGNEHAIGTLRQTGTLKTGDTEQPVYELNQGGSIYKRLLNDDPTMRMWMARARKSQGWEIAPQAQDKSEL
jgi:hypothetical protein